MISSRALIRSSTQRTAAALLLALVLSACHVTSAPPRTSIAERTAPIPLAVRVCDRTDDMSAGVLLDAPRLFERVTTDSLAPADLVATVGPVDSTERTLVSSGFFLWTLGVIPWVKREQRDVQVSFRRAEPGERCGPPDDSGADGSGADGSGADGSGADGSGAATVVLDSRGRMTTVQGWAALLLQPTPWWAGDDYDFQQPRSQRGRNLRLRTREALSRAIVARASEIRALAGR